MRKAVIEPETAKRRGCVFKLIGDGLLAEFGSVVDAVECAVSLQRALDERNADVPQNERLELRIGLNLGEVVVDGDDRYGEGVNASVQLQPLADPGGICISGNVVSEVEETLSFGFESMDAQQVKNIAEPIAVYRLVQEGTSPKCGWRRLLPRQTTHR
ncbi:adenylate/guanylate cyclase domain-containing protein [Rhizobium fabae]|uniref:Adenylate/guanylate cyclase domain-containing protein n=1 Tax=Rhizobium fabae TaxID=573179 RepID=A0ABY0B668_9HYPH|nr:adenylate/guanylate cyclase domain-containing protein [Rhizobium fabae]RUM11094.1 adenylate/guanylate cyclase domain-containing protein [Rhizobium fabae]